MQKFLRHGRCQPTWVSPSPSGKLISHGSKDSTFPVGQLSTLLAQSCQSQRKKVGASEAWVENPHTQSSSSSTNNRRLPLWNLYRIWDSDLGCVGHPSCPTLFCFNPPMTTGDMWLNPSSHQTPAASHLWCPYSSLNFASPSWAGSADIIKKISNNTNNIILKSDWSCRRDEERGRKERFAGWG